MNESDIIANIQSLGAQDWARRSAMINNLVQRMRDEAVAGRNHFRVLDEAVANQWIDNSDRSRVMARFNA